MSVVRLLEKNIFSGEVQAHYALIKSIREAAGKHCHDFFEIFIVLGGKVIHEVNHERQHLEEGALVFIRPEDVHSYEKAEGFDCQFINLAFSQKTVEALFGFLGGGFAPERLLTPGLPPRVTVPDNDRQQILKRFEKLNLLPDTAREQLKTELRTLLMELVTRYFPVNPVMDRSLRPCWLELLHQKMQQKENFTAGMPRLLQLAGKSPEHICRSFKKYFDLTPTGYINSLRLTYARNLLVSTDESVISICYESGFENLSHFYHVFRKRFAFSPRELREKERRNII